jgi:hypothetical protein
MAWCLVRQRQFYLTLSLCSVKLHVYKLPNVIKVVKCNRMKWIEYITWKERQEMYTEFW